MDPNYPPGPVFDEESQRRERNHELNERREQVLLENEEESDQNKLKKLESKMKELKRVGNNALNMLDEVEQRVYDAEYYTRALEYDLLREEYRALSLEDRVSCSQGETFHFRRGLDKLSFTQNSRVAKSLKLRYDQLVTRMIQRDYNIKVSFEPLNIFEEDELFRSPQDCGKYLTKKFRRMREFMNTVNSRSSPLDKRSDKFLRIPGSRVHYPFISISENKDNIVIFRVTTSPIACLFDEYYYRRKMIFQFVKNLFYNLSVLEYQVSAIKEYEEKIFRVVFVYELKMSRISNLEKFITFYSSIFKHLHKLMTLGKFKMILMSDVDNGSAKI